MWCGSKKTIQLFFSVHSLLLREVFVERRVWAAQADLLVTSLCMDVWCVSDDTGTGARDTPPLSVRSIQHLHTGYRKTPSVGLWILRMTKMYRITPQQWKKGKKLQRQNKAEKKLKAADLRIFQKCMQHFCSILQHVCLHWGLLKKWKVTPLAPFFPSLILGQNFEMVLYDQATDSPTMSYGVQGKKTNLTSDQILYYTSYTLSRTQESVQDP